MKLELLNFKDLGGWDFNRQAVITIGYTSTKTGKPTTKEIRTCLCEGEWYTVSDWDEPINPLIPEIQKLLEKHTK